MKLEISLLRQIDNPALDYTERTALRCVLAKELEDAGNYEGAQSAMGKLWQRVGERPVLDDLDERTAALVLLRVGTLTGWIGSARPIEDAQETAKDLITESGIRFKSLNDLAQATEAQIEIAWCYWREGAYDEARVNLRDALSQLTESHCELKALALVRLADVERAAIRLNDALRVLTEAAPLVEASSSHSLKGKFHNTLAVVLKNLGASEKRPDYIDRALVEFTAASFHFEHAGHTRFRARVENNLGFLFLRLDRFDEAHEHLEQARRLFISLKDSGSVAQVDETRARLLLAQGQNSEAERVVRAAVHTQEKGGEQSLLAESLITHGTALARLKHYEKARLTLQRAIEVAHLVGDNEKAGLAAITLIEELSKHLAQKEVGIIYERADELLADSQHLETHVRLRSCARRALEAKRARTEQFNFPEFVYLAPETAELLRAAHRVASSDGVVLITGETGTGKEVLARMIHEWSGRSGEFLPINCGALTDTLIESQLFGHKKGSFTDAVEDHVGVVRQAAGGTLFLDEIGELDARNQGKLLRMIERGEIHPLGAPVPECVDVRIIAATNRNLEVEVAKSRFRDDLYYRVYTFHLQIPPLRERQDDIPAIAEHFIQMALATTRKQVVFTPEAIDAIRKLPLKGNVRELRTLIERTILVAADGTTITPEAVEAIALRQEQSASFANPWENYSLQEEMLRYEGAIIKLALNASNGSVTAAARLLGISHQSLSFILQGRQKTLQQETNLANRRKRSIMRAL
jgi:transcriptional regulator with PAS, ATPase and Fis domain